MRSRLVTARVVPSSCLSGSGVTSANPADRPPHSHPPTPSPNVRCGGHERAGLRTRTRIQPHLEELERRRGQDFGDGKGQRGVVLAGPRQVLEDGRRLLHHRSGRRPHRRVGDPRERLEHARRRGRRRRVAARRRRRPLTASSGGITSRQLQRRFRRRLADHGCRRRAHGDRSPSAPRTGGRVVVADAAQRRAPTAVRARRRSLITARARSERRV